MGNNYRRQKIELNVNNLNFHFLQTFMYTPNLSCGTNMWALKIIFNCCILFKLFIILRGNIEIIQLEIDYNGM